REGVGEVLGLVLHEAVAELHDADRVRGHAVVGDHALAHPHLAAAEDPAHAEVALRRMAAALRLDPRAAPEALARLRVVEDRVVRVDRVLRLDVTALRGLPVLPHASPDVVVIHHALQSSPRPSSHPCGMRMRHPPDAHLWGHVTRSVADPRPQLRGRELPWWN